MTPRSDPASRPALPRSAGSLYEPMDAFTGYPTPELSAPVGAVGVPAGLKAPDLSACSPETGRKGATEKSAEWCRDGGKAGSRCRGDGQCCSSQADVVRRMEEGRRWRRRRPFVMATAQVSLSVCGYIRGRFKTLEASGRHASAGLECPRLSFGEGAGTCTRRTQPMGLFCEGLHTLLMFWTGRESVYEQAETYWSVRLEAVCLTSYMPVGLYYDRATRLHTRCYWCVRLGPVGLTPYTPVALDREGPGTSGCMRTRRRRRQSGCCCNRRTAPTARAPPDKW